MAQWAARWDASHVEKPDMLVDLLLGSIQGLTEWLPVSSEGVVTAVYSFFFDRSLSESIFYSLWLHLGTVFSVIIAFRKELLNLARDVLSDPRHPSPLFSYLVVSTAVSAVVGFPLLISIEEMSARLGAIAMGLVGMFMLATGVLQVRRRSVYGERGRDVVAPTDAIVAGIAQGFAVLPGLSRSGLTVSVLLARHVHRREALVLSFLMSIPASLGAGIYSGLGEGLFTSGGAIVAAAIACVVGFVTIRALLAVAERVNFAGFVMIVGAATVAGAIWQAFS